MVAVAIWGLACLWVAFSRSLIPTEVSGVVEEIGWVDGANGRWQTVVVGGRELVVDPREASRMEVGDDLEKVGWTRTLEVDGETAELPISEEIWRLAVVTMLVVAATAWILHPLLRVRQAHGASAMHTDGPTPTGRGAGSLAGNPPVGD